MLIKKHNHNIGLFIASKIVIIVLLFFSKLSGGNFFGYISYSTSNIGDDIQALAAKQFLPENTIAIDREFIHEFHHEAKVHTIINGWYMWTKNLGWYQSKKKAPEKSWPPSFVLNPLILSIHFTPGFVSSALSDEGVEYLKKYSPIGARDYYTLQELQNKNIPSYFSGCLTLTLENSCKERTDTIYAVDIDQECINFIKSKTGHKIEIVTHHINSSIASNNEKRLKHAQAILEKYKQAKCVITSRLHATMPCLAFQTPVLLLNTSKDQCRFTGLKELVHNCSKKEFIDGLVDFNFNNPPTNPTTYLSLRENLIKIVTDWIHDKKCDQ